MVRRGHKGTSPQAVQQSVPWQAPARSCERHGHLAHRPGSCSGCLAAWPVSLPPLPGQRGRPSCEQLCGGQPTMPQAHWSHGPLSRRMRVRAHAVTVIQSDSSLERATSLAEAVVFAVKREFNDPRSDATSTRHGPSQACRRDTSSGQGHCEEQRRISGLASAIFATL